MSAAGVLDWGSSRPLGSGGTAYPHLDPTQEVTSSSSDPNLLCLARQLFLAVPRRQIFFVATGDEIDVYELCARLAVVLSALRKGKVALVDGRTDSPIAVALKQHSRLNNMCACECAEGPLNNQMYRVPAHVIEEKFEQRAPTRDLDLPFAYLLFAGRLTDSAAPLFCRVSEGCVLVVAAHITHRQAALRAKEILQQWSAQLLGVVLTNRTFPVPECIYRRL